MSLILNRPIPLFAAAALLRVGMLAWGNYQDTHSPIKYTDIDYLVFTDAARFVSRGMSPYRRDTYRYTPLQAWLLLPTTRPGLFDFGKWLFTLGDLITGLLIFAILRHPKTRSGKYGLSTDRASRFAAIWVLNPMVANISTRGSCEGLLVVFVMFVLWAALRRYWIAAGAMLGLAVHFKIYPFIYGASLVWYQTSAASGASFMQRLTRRPTMKLALSAFTVFMALNVIMYTVYGQPFIEHSYSYHLIRIDHRHNFSVYSTLLHLRSAIGSASRLRVESLAFVPQLFLAVVAIPLALSSKDLAGSMLAQTFAFVTFNKVCTSQYFLWYMVFLPLYLPDSRFLQEPRTGILALVSWVLGQAAWLQQGYQLEFLGESTFVPGLWLSTLVFFIINSWILGIIVSDITNRPSEPTKRILKKVQ